MFYKIFKGTEDTDEAYNDIATATQMAKHYSYFDKNSYSVKQGSVTICTYQNGAQSE